MRFRIFVICLFLIIGQGCATAKKMDSTSDLNPSLSGPASEIYGPPTPEIEPTYGPEPIRLRPVVLVLGPGLARGFAYVGVFRALEDAKVPIGAILGTEMGGLVGTLYAMSSSLNQFEWGLQKFKEDIFKQEVGFFSGKRDQLSEGKKLEVQLAQIFKNKDLGDAKIPIQIAVQSTTTGVLSILSRGKIVEILRAAIAKPNVFTPGNLSLTGDNRGAISAGSTRPFLVNEARGLGMGPVIVVDVLTDSDSTIALDELKEADLVIKPDVNGISYMDFQKRTDVAFRGKTATLQKMAEIRRLVGMPETDLGRSAYP